MRCPSVVSIARRFGSSRPSNRRENRLAFMMVFWCAFMHHSTGRVRSRWPRQRFNSKNALHKATETVCMSNNGKRVAWVTGGGSGIGEAGAEALAAEGWTLVVSGRRRDALDAVVAKITKSGGKAEAITLDVSKAAVVNKAAEQILSHHGRIDLLVNSAGINVPKRSWADMELEGWNKLVEINLNGVLYCMRASCLSPGEVATPILKLRPVVPSEAEQARMLQSEDLGRTIAFVASMPPRVCMNEILISPTWNRGFIQTPHSRD